MSRRLDVPLALGAWLIGFAWVAHTRSWMPLAVLQVSVATRLVVGDPATRALFKPRSMAFALGISAALLTVVATYSLFGPISEAVPAFGAAIRRLYAVLRSEGYAPLPLTIVILTIVAAEEIVWRGRMLGGDETSSRPVPWQVAQALLYAAVYGFSHSSSGSILLVFIAFGFGAIWALLRLASGSLWAPLVAHALWDMAVLILWPVIV